MEGVSITLCTYTRSIRTFCLGRAKWEDSNNHYTIRSFLDKYQTECFFEVRFKIGASCCCMMVYHNMFLSACFRFRRNLKEWLSHMVSRSNL